MRRNKYIPLLLAALFGMALGGCGGSGGTTEQYTVALVAKSTQTEFWLSVFAGAEAAATEYNMELTIVGPETEEDYETQNQMVEEAARDGADAIVFSAIDFENNAASIDSAAQQGVRIVAIDSNVASDQVSTYIGTDNYAAGQMAAQAALDRVEGPLKVGVVNYDISSANGQERERGATDLFLKSGRAEIVSVINTLADAEQAQTDTAALLRAYSEINVLVAFNEPTSVGAARAVEEAGRSDDLFLVGFDSNVITMTPLPVPAASALLWAPALRRTVPSTALLSAPTLTAPPPS